MKLQNGNALFLILIAVGLFAALSYAITQSGRGGGNINKEELSLQAARLVQYASSVKNAITRIRTVGGHGKRDADFSGAPAVGPSDNANCTQDTCEVFNSSAFGAAYIPPDPAWLIPDNGDERWGEYRTSTARFREIGGEDEGDLMLVLSFMSEDMCKAVNRLVGVTTGDQPPPEKLYYGMNTYTWYRGGDSGGNIFRVVDDVFDGEHTGCFKEYNGPNFTFYHILIIDISS